MAITAADIHNQSFSIDRKGYDVDEVDVFLEHVAAEIDILNNRIAELEGQLSEEEKGGFEVSGTETIESFATDTEGEENVSPIGSVVDVVTSNDYEARIAEKDGIIAEKDSVIADLNNQLDEKKANDSAISQALIIAQRSADDIIARANSQASDTIQDARDEATRILNRANNDKQAVLDSIRQLEDDREDTREEYQDILRDFISDATRKLADLGATTNAVPSGEHVSESTQAAENFATQGTGEFEAVEEEGTAAQDYVTPQATDSVVAAATPVASTMEKDLSGFGDADDDFEFEEID